MSAATVPGQDPSMEDILASIRKILNEEEAAAPAPPPPDAPARAPAAPRRAASGRAAPGRGAARRGAAGADGGNAGGRARAAPAAGALARPGAGRARGPAAGSLCPAARAPAGLGLCPSEGLVAPATAAAAAAILGQLARTVAAERSSPVHRGGPSIEDVVREELRPLLKDWMDTHLPALMERLVRAEIERVVSRSLG